MTVNETDSPSPFWRLQIGGTALLTAAALWLFLLVSHDWAFVIKVLALRISVGFAVMLALRQIYRRWRVGAYPFSILAFRAGSLSVAAAAVDNAIAIPLLNAFGLKNLVPTPDSAWMGSFLLRCILYTGWSAVYFGLRESVYASRNELRLARLEAATRQTELSTLRAQVNAHFLFNALNSILAEVDDNPQTAKTLTQSLANYLHFSLRRDGCLAPLREELDAMRDYLRVEKIRFGPAFAYEIEATAESQAALAPPAVLQPLVENAVKYGMETSEPPLRLKIAAEVRDGRLRLAVSNTGVWVEEGMQAAPSHRIGLANLRRRLGLLYPGRAHLSRCCASGEVKVEVSFPV